MRSLVDTCAGCADYKPQRSLECDPRYSLPTGGREVVRFRSAVLAAEKKEVCG